MKIYIFIFVFSLSLYAFGQDKVIDSLKANLNKASHDTTRCNILNAIIEAENDLDNVLKYSYDITRICEANLADSELSKPEYLKFKRSYAGALGVIGNILDIKNETVQANDYYLKSVGILREIGEKKLLCILLNNIAVNYSKQGIISKALLLNFESLKIKEELKDSVGIGYSLNNIGLIYDGMGDSPKALEYYSRSLKIRNIINDKKGTAQSLVNIGSIYLRQDSSAKALNYFQKSLQLNESIGNKVDMCYSLSHIGHTYMKSGDFEKALESHFRSLETAEAVKDKLCISIALNNIGTVYLKQKKYDLAGNYFLRSLSLSNQLGYPVEIARTALQLNTIYKLKGDYKNALHYYELHIHMRDSINNMETKKASLKSQFKYEYEKKAAADSVKIAEEKKMSDIKFEHEQHQRYFLYSSLFLTAMFGIFMFQRFRVARKQKKFIERQNLLLEEKQKEILSSIHYAKRIQTSLLPTEKYIERILKK